MEVHERRSNLLLRPGSVKGTTFLLGLITLVMTKLYWDAVSAHGAEEVWQAEPVLSTALLPPIGLAFSLFGRRHKISYYCIAIILGLTVLNTLRVVFERWNLAALDSQFFATDSISDRFGEVLILGIIILLFYRFTFGLPSRRYYGVAIIPGTAIQAPNEGQ